MNTFLDHILQLDKSIFFAVNSAKTPFLDWLMIHLSYPGYLWTVIAAFAIWIFIKGNKRERVVITGIVVVVLLSDFLCAQVLKPLVGRPRPFNELDNIVFYKHGRWIVTSPQTRQALKLSLAWPSCHAMNMWTATGFTLLFYPRTAMAIGTVAAAVCYSRIYLGHHYPLDVISGLILGFTLGISAAATLKALERKLTRS